MKKKNEFERIKITNQKVIVAFGDFIGFSAWARRSSTSIENYKWFIEKIFDEWLKLQSLGYYVKPLADGVMYLLEIRRKRNGWAAQKILCDSLKLRTKLITAINKMSYPRPEGFRIRVTACDAWKLIGFPRNHQKRVTDYIGYGINMAFLTLRYDKFRPFICHEGVRELLSRNQMKNSGLKFEKIIKSKTHLEGVDDEDLDALWEFKS